MNALRYDAGLHDDDLFFFFLQINYSVVVIVKKNYSSGLASSNFVSAMANISCSPKRNEREESD